MFCFTDIVILAWSKTKNYKQKAGYRKYQTEYSEDALKYGINEVRTCGASVRKVAKTIQYAIWNFKAIITIYFNKVVFHSVLGLTSPMAFP